MITLSASLPSDSSGDALCLSPHLALYLPIVPLPRKRLYLEALPGISHFYSIIFTHVGHGRGSFSDVRMMLQSEASTVALGLITMTFTSDSTPPHGKGFFPNPPSLSRLFPPLSTGYNFDTFPFAD